jgi:hypothetical protein
MTGKSIRWAVAITVAILVALTVQIWAALHWAANYDADEANFGLIAVDMMHGIFVPYFQVRNSMGTLESFVAAGLMQITGVGILPVRLSAIIFYGLFLITLGLLLKRVFTDRVAFIALLLAAFPSWKILWWMYRPVGCFSPLLGLTTMALLLVVIPMKKQRSIRIRIFLIGTIMGLAIWEHPLATYYAFIMGICYLLTTPEWSELYRRIVPAQKKEKLSWIQLMPGLLTISIFLLVLFSFFMGKDKPAKTFASIRFDLLLAVFLLAGAVALALFLLSKRKQHIIFAAAILAVGFMLGNLPQWGSYIYSGIKPNSSVIMGSLSQLPSRLYLGFTQILPSLWGVPFLGWEKSGQIHELQEIPRAILWNRPAPLLILWLIFLIVILYSITKYFWDTRKPHVFLVTLRPITKEQGQKVFLGLLFLLPIVVGLSAGNVIDVASNRYFIPSWQAGIVMVALGINYLWEKRKVVGYLLVGLIIVMLGVFNLREIHAYWHSDRYRWCSGDSLDSLLQCLQENEVQGVYADYGLVSPLNFIFHKNPVFTTYYHTNFYPGLNEQVQSKNRLAIILPTLAILPDSANSVSDLEKHLKNIFNQASDSLYWTKQLDARLANLEFVKRERVRRYWDIWIFNNKNTQWQYH